MRIIFFVMLCCISCGNPQDKNKDSGWPDGEGPLDGVTLVNDADDLLITICDSIIDGRCESYDAEILNEIGYKQNNVKSVTKDFRLRSTERITIGFDGMEFVTLSCRYAVDRNAITYLKMELLNGDAVQKLTLEDQFSIDAGINYVLRVSLENVYHCSDNWFRFPAIIFQS